jgi:hypothetical protein
VRELTDGEVLEIQVVENLQRSDLHELEEAEGYERLLKCAHPSGEKYSVEDIAAKVGRSRSYVFASAEALRALPGGEESLLRRRDRRLEGAADRAHRAPRHPAPGAEGHHRRAEYGNGHGPMSYREAHEHILQTYMLKLSERAVRHQGCRLLAVKAGACGPCPKRTGNQADLFGDVKSADVCTDPKCFDDKRQAHYGKAVTELEAKGNKVLYGDSGEEGVPALGRTAATT